MRRNPPWTREELILALDLYLRFGLIGRGHPEVLEISRVLNSLLLQKDRPDEARFRNPNGVAMKLANFASLDPDYEGTALPHGGQLDAQVWADFNNRRSELQRLAAAIRAGAQGD